MTMVLGPGSFVSRVFYAELADDTGNISAFLFREPGEDFWRIQMCFRYYEDDLAHGSKDRKSTRLMRAPPEQGLSFIVPTIKTMFEVVGVRTIEEVIIESDNPDEVMRRLREQPWAHTKTVTQEEVDAILGV